LCSLVIGSESPKNANICTGVWLENLKGRDNSGDLGMDGEENVRTTSDLREMRWESMD